LPSSEIVRDIEEKLKKAIEFSEKIGRIVGFVSRTSPSLINEEGGYVVFDVDPVVYFQNYSMLAQAGSILGVVDIKTMNVVSLKVLSVERRDILAELDLPDMYYPLPHSEASGLLTKTRIKAKPLLAYNPEADELTVANYVIEPQSPVVLLTDTHIIQKIMGLPTTGVFLGYATIGDTPAFEGNAPLFLPLKAFYQHILVLGTTGSGKTTLTNTLLYELSILDPDCRLFIVEDTPELNIKNKDYVSFVVAPDDAIIMLRVALRSNPDRIIFGELRHGSVAIELLKAFNSGHPGGITTIHANTGNLTGILHRLHSLISEVNSNITLEEIKSYIDMAITIEVKKNIGPFISNIYSIT